jgi:Tfp pilus assembly PilM family ATPase
MGCGCKNKPNNQAQPQQGPQVAQQQKMENARKINEDVKSAIKKTIEKYYNQGKTK